jgi:hypothetical protein
MTKRRKPSRRPKRTGRLATLARKLRRLIAECDRELARMEARP